MRAGILGPGPRDRRGGLWAGSWLEEEAVAAAGGLEDWELGMQSPSQPPSSQLPVTVHH